MQLKRYILLSILLLVTIGVYVQINIDTDYTADFFGSTITLPVSVWVVAPAVLMFVASLMHMGFYSVVHFIRTFNEKRDAKVLKKGLVDAVLGDSSSLRFRGETLKTLGKLLGNGRIIPTAGAVPSGDAELDRAVDAALRIERGEVVDLGRFKLPAKAALVIQNRINRMRQEPAFAEEVLKGCDQPSEVCREAFEIFAGFAEKRKMDKIDLPLTKNVVFILLSRLNNEESNSITLSTDEIIHLCEAAGFDRHDFIQMAKTIKTRLEPDALLELFYQLQSRFESAGAAYLYINLELEKLDTVREFLAGAPEEEFREFRSFLALKECGVRVTLEEFIH